MKKNTSLLTPIITLKGGGGGKNWKSQEREGEMVWNLNHCSDRLQMPVSQSAKDNILVSKQAATVTYCMERSQATSAQLSESPEAEFTSEVLLAY